MAKRKRTMCIDDYTLEETIAIWCKPDFAKELKRGLKGMGFEILICDCSTDIALMPWFISIVDGELMNEDDNNRIMWWCTLRGYNSTSPDCPNCDMYDICTDELYDPEEPLYDSPIILLNPEKNQKDVFGMLYLSPPMTVGEIVTKEFVDWVKYKILLWKEKADDWRWKYEAFRFYKKLDNF